MSSSPAFAVTVLNGSVKFENADGTTLKALNTALGGSGGYLESLYMTNDDTSDVFVGIYRTISSVDYLLQTVKVPAGAGTEVSGEHVAALDVLALGIFGSSFNSYNKYELPMDDSMVLKVGVGSAVTSGKTVYVNADFKVY
jgi:hypothetical protein